MRACGIRVDGRRAFPTPGVRVKALSLLYNILFSPLLASLSVLGFVRARSLILWKMKTSVVLHDLIKYTNAIVLVDMHQREITVVIDISTKHVFPKIVFG